MTPAKQKTRKHANAGRRPNPAYYLYGVSAASERIDAADCPGVEGNFNVRAVASNGLSCWISEVGREQFVTNLQNQIENLEWIATTGVNHQKTVEKLAAQTTIVPARFGAVFLSEESLRKDVRGRARRLAQALERLKDTEEWGIKIFHAPQASPTLPRVSSGRDYLRQKAKSLKVRSKAPPAGEFREFLSALQGNSLEWHPGKASAAQQDLVWIGSFLLRKKGHRDFDAALRKYASQWQKTHRIESTGPWPPYSFV